MSAQSDVYELADEYVERFAALDPLGATGEGITGHDHEMTDYSPDGIDERAEHDRATLRARRGRETSTPMPTASPPARCENGSSSRSRSTTPASVFRDIRILGSPVQGVRMVFDLMPRDTEEQWHTIAGAARARSPRALEHRNRAHRRRAAGNRGRTASGREVRAAGRRVGWRRRLRRRPFFLTLVDEYDARGFTDSAFRHRLEELATRATAAYAAMGRYLVEEYAPHAAEQRPGGTRALLVVRT